MLINRLFPVVVLLPFTTSVVRVWNSHLKVEYSNHSVAPVGQIFGSRGPLECLVPSNERCCGDGTGGHWYHPDGTPVSGDRSRFIRSTRGGLGEEEAAVYLHWRFYHGYDKQLGLFRCEIPASGANSDIQVVYVGLYRGDRPNQGKQVVDSLTFHLDSVSTVPFQPGPPVFTLTCNSSGGPATTVMWKRGNSLLSEDSAHSTTKTLVSQTGPHYSSTLTVRGRNHGTYYCVVSNSKGNSTRTLPVAGAHRPESPTAVQVNASAVRVSWTTPSSGPTPSGYRIYYQAEGDQTFTAVDTGQEDTEYLLTDLRPGTTYNITMVTVSQYLPSEFQTLESVTIVTGPKSPNTTTLQASVSPTGVTVTWDEQPFIDVYKISFERVTGSLQLLCPDITHQGTYESNTTEYSITGLHEYSVYNISVTAVNIAGNSSSSFTVATRPSKPSAPPQNVMAQADISTITIQWDEVNCADRNSAIVNYSISYNLTNGVHVMVSVEPTNYTITGLRPGAHYSIELAAVNAEGQVGPSEIITVMTSQDPDHSSLGGEAIAGAVVAMIVGLVLFSAGIVTLVWLAWRNKGKVKKSAMEVRAVSHPEGVLYATVQHPTEKNLSVPVIQNFPEKPLYVKEGETILLQVQVTGSPAPSLSWYSNDEEVTEDYSLSLAQDGTLTIPSAEPRHSGAYRLVATNTAGSVSKEVHVTVLGDEEPNPLAPKVTFRPIPLPEFGEYVAVSHANLNHNFLKQYEALDSGSEHPMTIGLSTNNTKKNRFKNIAVYDDNRITLQRLEHRDCQEPYVNACFVNGYSLRNKYIATQGPMSKTMVDFWRLVWQEKPPTIVMVTNVKEGGKVKCEQYWPDSGTKRVGPFQITITDQQMFADYTVRVLQVTFTDSPDMTLKVTQYHYTTWPDHGVPEYATSILNFHRRVKSQHSTSRGPLLVHCSAGVGRTGTFIAIDCVLEQVDRTKSVDIAGTVNKLRHQRTKMVQKPEQYVLIHDAILEAVTCGNTQIPAADFLSASHQLREVDRFTGITGVESQFHVLDQVTPKPHEVSRHVAFRYQHKNRSMDFVPSDYTRVALERDNPNYIHANFVNGYKQAQAFIIAQGPMESTCRDFWKMVHDRRCGVIVMLSQLQEDGEEACYKYWPESHIQKYGEIRVESVKEEQHEGYVVRSLIVTKSRESHQVTQFQVQNWSSSGQCSNFSTVLEVLEEMGSVQRRTGNTPVVVHCSDTVGRSGMFCAIATTIEKCKTEGVVDVLQIVKVLRVQKPGAVTSVEQYSCIFDVILLYLDSFDTYANFK